MCSAQLHVMRSKKAVEDMKLEANERQELLRKLKIARHNQGRKQHQVLNVVGPSIKEWCV